MTKHHVIFLIFIFFSSLINAQESRDEKKWFYIDYRLTDPRISVSARYHRTRIYGQQVTIVIKNLTDQKLEIKGTYTIHSSCNTRVKYFFGCCNDPRYGQKLDPYEKVGGEMYGLGTSFSPNCPKESAELIDDSYGGKGYNFITGVDIDIISIENLTEKEAKIAEQKRAAEDKRLADLKAAEEKRLAEKKAAEEKRIADLKAEEEKKAADKKSVAEKKALDENQVKKESTDNYNSNNKSSSTSGNTTSGSTNESSLDKFYEQQQAAKIQRDKQYDEYTRQNDAKKNQYLENVQNEIKQRQELLDIYNNSVKQQQGNIAALGNSLQTLSDNLIRQAEERRQSREAYEREMEIKREQARIRQEAEQLRKQIRFENRLSLFSQFPDRKIPLANESIGTNVLYYFAYIVDKYDINDDYANLNITDVFPVYKYGDGTWIYKNELVEKIFTVNEWIRKYQLKLVGFFTDYENAVKQRTYFIEDAKKYEMGVFGLKMFSIKKSEQSNGQVDFWGNPIKQN